MRAWQDALRGRVWTLDLLQSMFGPLPSQDATEIVYMVQHLIQSTAAVKKIQAHMESLDEEKDANTIMFCKDLLKIIKDQGNENAFIQYGGETEVGLASRYCDRELDCIVKTLNKIFGYYDHPPSPVGTRLLIPVLAFHGEHCLDTGIPIRCHVEWALLSILSHNPTLANRQRGGLCHTAKPSPCRFFSCYMHAHESDQDLRLRCVPAELLAS